MKLSRKLGVPTRTLRARLLVDAEHYTDLVADLLRGAQTSLWIATANVKELRMEAPVGTRARAKGTFVSILETLDALARKGVDVRLLHGAPPSGPFRAALAKTERLAPGTGWMRQCPRVHLKMIAIDGRALYLGSANLTGAGLGAKGEGRRNFEMGMVTDDELWLDAAQGHFESIFSGKECKGCKLRRVCPKPLDTLTKPARKAGPKRLRAP
jgi:phosphatidylserine/phosphatidylglycerophosphate/cardiolipin synthase-like enzyme